MTRKIKLELINSRGMYESLSNILNSANNTIVDLYDAAEDCESSGDFCKRINNIVSYRKFSVNRITKEYIRLEGVDTFGNKSYLILYKEA